MLKIPFPSGHNGVTGQTDGELAINDLSNNWPDHWPDDWPDHLADYLVDHPHLLTEH